jgi:sn-glycerol 3-phosphate transport system ATP-binding protein
MPRNGPSQPASRPTSTGASVRLIGVSRRWGSTSALDRISIEVAPGTFTVLLGPSGCGKTTCLRIVAGLETASEGRIEIAGRDVTNLPPAARSVAMVFQSYALFPHLSVAENIAFGLRARRVPKPERARRLARAVEILGIAHLLERKPGQLSGGQQQRVAIARSLINNPQLILADEPTGALDSRTSIEIMGIFQRLNREKGISIVVVTHEPDIAHYSDRLIQFKDGHIMIDEAVPNPRDAERELAEMPDIVEEEEPVA